MNREAHFEVYRDRSGEWRGRLVKNGRIICDSGEGYKRRFGALRWVEIVKGSAGAPVKVMEGAFAERTPQPAGRGR